MITPLPLETSYQSTRLPVTSQTTLNLYPHTITGYRPFPGLKVFSRFNAAIEALDAADGGLDAADGTLFTAYIAGGDDRGQQLMKNILYVVSGRSLFKIESAGSGSYIGVIDGTIPVSMATNGTQLIIVAGAHKYVYTASGGLAAITDSDLDDAYTVAYLDSRFIYDQPDGEFVASDLNDGTSIDPFYFAEAEAFPDNILAVYPLNQLIYMLGETSTEVWYTSGVGVPPLDRQAVIEHGLIGRYAVDSVDDTLYFVDHHRRPAVVEGAQYAPLILSSAMAKAWDDYPESAMSTVRVACYSHELENFIDFIFPQVDKVWTFHEPSRQWFEKTLTTTSAIRAFGKTLLLGESNATMYELDGYINDGDVVERTKDTGLINSETFGAPGRSMTLNTLYIAYDAPTEVTVNVYFSKDLTAFSNPRTFTVSGNGRKKLTSFGSFHEGIIRITTYATTKLDILSVSADVEFLDE